MSLGITGVSPLKEVLKSISNCKIGRKYKKTCKDGVLCSPVDEFDMIEKCTICDKRQ